MCQSQPDFGVRLLIVGGALDPYTRGLAFIGFRGVGFPH